MGETDPVPAFKKEQDHLYRAAAEEFGQALDRLANAYEADPDRRKDLLQEIHLQIWRSFDKFDSRCSLRSWIYRVAHNVAATHVVKQRRVNAQAFLTLEQAEAKATHEDIEFSTDRKQAFAQLLRLVQQLDPIDRQLTLAYLEGLDAESISDITGLSISNVWTKLHRIKAVLTRQFHAGGRHG